MSLLWENLPWSSLLFRICRIQISSVEWWGCRGILWSSALLNIHPRSHKKGICNLECFPVLEICWEDQLPSSSSPTRPAKINQNEDEDHTKLRTTNGSIVDDSWAQREHFISLASLPLKDSKTRGDVRGRRAEMNSSQSCCSSLRHNGILSPSFHLNSSSTAVDMRLFSFVHRLISSKSHLNALITTVEESVDLKTCWANEGIPASAWIAEFM